MDTSKEKFLRNEFLTMSLLGALGRSNTYPNLHQSRIKASFVLPFGKNLER